MRTIQSKLVRFCAMLVLAVLVGQLLFSVFLSKPYFVYTKKREVEKLFSAISQDYADDFYTLYGLTQTSAEQFGLGIIIFTPQGYIVYSNRNSAPSLTMEMGKVYDVRDFAEKPSAFVAQNLLYDDQNEYILLYGLVETEAGSRYVVIQTPVDNIERSILTLSQVNATISLAILVAAIPMAWFFAGKISKPIHSISGVAQRVAEQDFSASADESVNTEELKELAVSINTMSDKIRRLIYDLQNSNEQLQKDIDAQKRMDKTHREFVANVSHELKTPLALMMLYSENLKNQSLDVDRDFYCDTIIEEAARMNDMVGSLLNISSIENRLSGLKLEPLSLSLLIRREMAKNAPLYEGLQVECVIDEDIAVMGDEEYLRQAVGNYLGNAVSHTAEGGRLQVALEESGGRARFTVFNEGSHIESSDIDRIWDSFYRADKARTRQEGSHAGLGLYIVKTVITAHGGAFGAENLPDGVAFWFELDRLAG